MYSLAGSRDRTACVSRKPACYCVRRCNRSGISVTWGRHLWYVTDNPPASLVRAGRSKSISTSWLLASSWSEVLESVLIALARGKTERIKGGLTRITEGLLAADGVEIDFEVLVEAIGICDGAGSWSAISAVQCIYGSWQHIRLCSCTIDLMSKMLA